MAVVVSTAQGGPSGGRELQTPARERRYETRSPGISLIPVSLSGYGLYMHT